MTLKGLLPQPLQATPISANKLYNAAKGNEAWAFAVVDTLSHNFQGDSATTTPLQPEIEQLLQKFEDIFHDPKTLPRSRSYDHAIPLISGAVPINARPYHYSPQHKTEIETQVK